MKLVQTDIVFEIIFTFLICYLGYANQFPNSYPPRCCPAERSLHVGCKSTNQLQLVGSNPCYSSRKLPRRRWAPQHRRGLEVNVFALVFFCYHCWLVSLMQNLCKASSPSKVIGGCSQINTFNKNLNLLKTYYKFDQKYLFC